MKVSSKGQVVIPSSIRKEMGITSGDELSVYTDGHTIYIKKIDKKRMLKEFRELNRIFSKMAEERGYKPEDVMKWVEEIRYGEKSDDR